jgi:hypothetical protein
MRCVQQCGPDASYELQSCMSQPGTFTNWTVQLTRYFFGRQFEGQRIRLMVTREVLDQNFASLGGANGFLAAMSTGPTWLVPENPTMRGRGLRLYRLWKYPRIRPPKYPKSLCDLDDAPPFLPYLCLLCLAWTEGGDQLAANAYYERLTLLYQNHDLSGHLGGWLALWTGLAKWTEDLEYRRGQFVVEILGGWQHVGIPRSQVIFTPAKIHRFPELFLHCGCEAEATVTRETLRHLILTTDNIAASVLGPMVFHEVKSNSALGVSALDIIREHLENWDGESLATEGMAGGGGAGGPRYSDTLLLALRPVHDNSQWQVTLALDRDARCEQVMFTARRLKVRPYSETIATIVDEADLDVDATEFADDWKEGIKFHGALQQGDLVDEELSYKLAGRSVRIFDKWVGNLLVECRALPLEGPVYFLVHSETLLDWHNWLRSCGERTKVLDVTWSGLPSIYSLFCIPDIRVVPPELRSRLPDGLGDTASRIRGLRLVSGTRCNSSTARRVYADYDPPLLIVQAPPTATLSVTGAKHTLLDTPSNTSGLFGNTVRSYALTIEADQSVVIASLTLDGERLAGVAFGVHREGSLGESRGSTLHFDSLGNAAETPGLNGLMAPEHVSRWTFKEGQHELGKPLSDALLEDRAFTFIESLHMHNNRLAYPEYKRRAVQLAGAETWQICEETRWLAQLGFIDLQVDSRGRWSHIHPLPLQLYPLPFLAGDCYQFVLAGTSETKRIRETLRAAVEILDCEVRVAPRTHKMLPPRITLLHRKREAGEELAREMDLRWIAEPPANQLALWSGDLQEWLQSITWFPDPGPNPFAEYSPVEFRFIPQQQFAAPWHLRRFIDPFTLQQWHCLYRPSNWEHDEQHAYVRDSTWAMWRVHVAIAQDDGMTSLAYDALSGRLIVPCQLNFPYLLSRALAACSGLPPQKLFRVPPYMNHDAGVLLPDAAPYGGQCFAYQLVPHPIAEIIAGKVNARLVDVSINESNQ